MAKDTMDAFPGDTGKRKRKPPTAWELLDDAVSDGTRETIKAAMELAANPYLTPAEPIADTLDAICGDTLDTARDAARDATETCMAQLTGGFGDIMGEMDAYLAEMPSIPAELTAIPSIPADLIDALGATLGDTPDAVKAWTEAWIMLAPTLSMTDAMKCFLDAQQQHTPTNEALWELWNLGQMQNLSEIQRELSDDKKRLTNKQQKTLDKYFRQVAVEYPDMGVIPTFALAARRARADGHNIPTIGAELMLNPDEAKEIDELTADEPAAKVEPEATDTDLEADTDTDTDTDLKARLGKYVATPTGELRDIFTGGEDGHILGLPGERSNFKFDEYGKLNELSLNGEKPKALTMVQTRFLNVLLRLAQVTVLRRKALGISDTSTVVHFPLAQFFSDTTIDTRPHKLDKETGKKIKRIEAADGERTSERLAFISKTFIEPLKDTVLLLPDGSAYWIAHLDHYDGKTDQLYIATPALFQIVKMCMEHEREQRGKKHKPWLANVFYATVLSGKENDTAMEVAAWIASGLMERGTTPQKELKRNKPAKKPLKETIIEGDKKVIIEYAPEPIATVTTDKEDRNGNPVHITKPMKQPADTTVIYHTTFREVIEHSPQLKERIARVHSKIGKEEMKVRMAASDNGVKPDPKKLAAARKEDHRNDAQHINSLYRNTFEAAIRLIMEKSKLPYYYKDLTITTGNLRVFKPPTNTTLDECIIIKHKGKNPEYIEGSEIWGEG